MSNLRRKKKLIKNSEKNANEPPLAWMTKFSDLFEQNFCPCVLNCQNVICM